MMDSKKDFPSPFYLIFQSYEIFKKRGFTLASINLLPVLPLTLLTLALGANIQSINTFTIFLVCSFIFLVTFIQFLAIYSTLLALHDTRSRRTAFSYFYLALSQSKQIFIILLVLFPTTLAGLLLGLFPGLLLLLSSIFLPFVLFDTPNFGIVERLATSRLLLKNNYLLLLKYLSVPLIFLVSFSGVLDYLSSVSILTIPLAVVNLFFSVLVPPVFIVYLYQVYLVIKQRHPSLDTNSQTNRYRFLLKLGILICLSIILAIIFIPKTA